MLLKKLFFMVLLLAPFFSNSIFADTIPATQTVSTSTTCTGSSLAGAQTGVYNVITPAIVHNSTTCAGNYASQLNAAYDGFTVGQCPYYWYGDTYSGTAYVGYYKADYKCDDGAGRIAFHTLTTTTVKYEAGYITYSCPPDYTLNGVVCDSIPEPDECGFDNPAFFPDTPTNYQSFCVTQADGVTQCSYTAGSNEQGGSNNRSYTPTNETCDCDPASPGAIPCGDIADNPTNQPDPQTDCINTGGLSFCPADPEERCDDNSGVTSCDTNCGYINDTFYCGDSDLPEAQECQSGDTRLECVGIPDNTCPVGFSCTDNSGNPITDGSTGNGTNNETPACQTGDARPECSGLPAGAFPNQQDLDLSGIEALLAQGNKNTNDIKKSLEGFDSSNEMKAVDDKIKADGEAQDALDSSAISDTSAGETSISNANSSAGNYFKGFVTNLVPAPPTGCSPLVSNFGDGKVITVDICNESSYFKTLLAWLLNIFLAMHLFHMMTVRAAPVKT